MTMLHCSHVILSLIIGGSVNQAVWRCAQIQLPTDVSGNNWLVFQAIRGADQFSDIAVDDVNLNTGSCENILGVSNQNSSLPLG